MKQLIQGYKQEFVTNNINILPCTEKKTPLVEWDVLKKYNADLTEKETIDIKNINEQALSEHTKVYGAVLPPDLIVIDIDPFKKGDIFNNEEGFKNAKFQYIEEIRKKTNIDLFEECKFIVSTPGKEITVGGESILGGGFHFYFKKKEEDYNKQCSSNFVLKSEKIKKIDIRKHGHYVIGPGSIRGGGCYELYDEDMSINNITFLPEELNLCIYSTQLSTIANNTAINRDNDLSFDQDVVRTVTEKICQIKSISGENGNDSVVKVLQIILDYLPIEGIDMINDPQVESILKTWDDNCSFNTAGQHYYWTVPVLQAKMKSIMTGHSRKKPIGYLYMNRVQEAISNANERTKKVYFHDLNFLSEFMTRLGYSFSSQFGKKYYQKDKGVLKNVSHKNELMDNWTSFNDAVQTNIIMEMQQYITGIGYVPGPVCPKTLGSVINALSHNCKFDPFAKTLLNLPKWDGKKRISTFFQDYCYTSPKISKEALEYLYDDYELQEGETKEDFEIKMQKSYDLYHEQAAKSFFIGNCSLAFDSVKIFELMLVFLGPQGCGKSTLVRRMAFQNSYYSLISLSTIQHPDFETKMGRKHLQHRVLELAENAQRDKADEELLKAFLSSPTFNCVQIYKQDTPDIPKWFNVIATSNNDTFLRDITGNRRYVPIQIGECLPNKISRIKNDDVGRDMEQIYAEAMHYFNEENKVNNPNIPFEYCEIDKRRTFAINGDALYFLSYLNHKHYDIDSLSERVEQGIDKMFKNRKDKKDSSPYFLAIELRNACGSSLDERNCSKQRLSNILIKLGYIKIAKCVSVGGVKAKNRWIYKKDLEMLEAKKSNKNTK